MKVSKLKDQYDVTELLLNLIIEQHHSSGDVEAINRQLSEWVRDTQGDMAFAWFPISGHKEQAQFIAVNGNVDHAVREINEYHVDRGEEIFLFQALEYLDPSVIHYEPTDDSSNSSALDTSNKDKHLTMSTKNRTIIVAYLITLMLAFILVPWRSETNFATQGAYVNTSRSLGYALFWQPPKAEILGRVEIDLTRIGIELALITLLFLTIYVLLHKKTTANNKRQLTLEEKANE